MMYVVNAKGPSALLSSSRKLTWVLVAHADKCVLDSCRYMQQRGWDVTYLPVQTNGLVDMRALEAAMRPETAIVSIMLVNNEIGARLRLTGVCLSAGVCRAGGMMAAGLWKS